jgi:hypothetical protein
MAINHQNGRWRRRRDPTTRQRTRQDLTINLNSGNPGAHVGDLMETIGQGCWLCNIFALSYDISVVLSDAVFDKLGAPLANLLIAFALGVWVLFQAAKLIRTHLLAPWPATGIASMIFIRFRDRAVGHDHAAPRVQRL